MRSIIIVSGLPRSGTSLMMQMLAAGGVSVMTDGIRGPDVDNPRGYLECERIKELERGNDKTWLREARGRAIKVISFLLKDLPPDNAYRVIFMRRDLDEVVVSQRRMLQRRGIDDALPDKEAKGLYERHLAQVELLLGRTEFTVLDVSYRDAIVWPTATAHRVNDFLGGRLDERAMVGVVDEELYRNRASGKG